MLFNKPGFQIFYNVIFLNNFFVGIYTLLFNLHNLKLLIRTKINPSEIL